MRSNIKNLEMNVEAIVEMTLRAMIQYFSFIVQTVQTFFRREKNTNEFSFKNNFMTH